MKNVFFIISLAILASCSKSNSPEKETNSPASVTETVLPDSENDRTLYINKAGYFTETDEFYVSLLFKKPISQEYFDSLTNKADSTVFEDDGTGRFRLPMQVAREAFDLMNLDEVKIYNDRHRFLTSAKLVRVEYVVDVNGYFVAVFKPKEAVPEDEGGFYCIGTAEVTLDDIETQTIKSKELTERIKKELAINPFYMWSVEHVHVQPDNTTYSIFAFAEESNESVSYLTEFSNDSLKVLYKLQDEIAFYGILPVAAKINGKPVLLLHIVLPESDAVDDYVLAIYDGKEYRLVENHRIELR